MERHVQRLREIISSEIEETGELTLSIEQYLDKSPTIDNVRTLFVESTTFIDLYKKINYKKVTSTLTEEDLLTIPIIDSIIEVEHIHEVVINQPVFFEKMLDATYEFYNATILEKIAQLKALSIEDKQFLLEMIPSFQEDLDFYDQKVELEIFYLYYKTLETFYHSKQLPFMKDSIIDQIVNFIKNLYHYDQENFIHVVLELALIDYKFSNIFLKCEKYPGIANGRRKTMYRINIFEEGTEKDILDYAILDDYYLFEVIDTYLFTRNSHTKEENYKASYETIEVKKAKEKIKKIEERMKRYGNK